MADDDSSDLSSLSSLSPVPSDIESDAEPQPETKKGGGFGGLLKFFPKLPKGLKATNQSKEPSPPPRKRSPSPPHENAFEDNPDIAFLVMFRSRFNDAFPKSLVNFGPQELELDIVDNPPGERVEAFLCALLFLLLNRKQDVKAGQYSKALDDALSAHKSQWPRSWGGVSPLSGSNTFHSIAPTQRLSLLRALALWSLSASETVKAIINKSYKGNRHEDDLNQPLSVQPWGSDSDKRRYYLIEGLDDTAFRVYRESNPAGFNRTWWSVAGSIDEIKALADKLMTKDGGPNSRKLAEKMLTAIPRFEATEEKRRRREYRQAQKARFKRPEPGFSVYEGRTRGKRIKYTYSDDDDFTDSSTRRSARNTGTSTPAEPTGPVTTASGRQIRAPPRLNASSAAGSVNGDSEDSRQQSEPAVGPGGRPRRAAAVNHGTNGWSSREARTRGRGSMDDDDDDDVVSEPELGDDEEEHIPDETEEEEEDLDEDLEMADDELGDEPRKSLIVKLSVKKSPTTNKPTMITPASEDDRTIRSDNELVDEIVAKPKERTPEPVINVATNKQTLSPVAVPTSLAFRGSPDKPHSLPRPVDVGSHE
ncbi:hypothetical protein CH63R_02358 [Colletotrichum higginsianum IMI 349063]|uniref:WHIM1 domain-containing protein n=1 Tax=Colletotrichum higginsianum (strain IMI 349063) TaxID=759273 RepID=A0A1B7YNW3_COLHI|nr:hypothetical protein CH63R_02358 [Colletotrichum higginsianum IMI 349063]OBR13632.1 hypothetical protein CH63R_02358 [Colletotrichum higginsianum IMI 349063]